MQPAGHDYSKALLNIYIYNDYTFIFHSDTNMPTVMSVVAEKNNCPGQKLSLGTMHLKDTEERCSLSLLAQKGFRVRRGYSQYIYTESYYGPSKETLQVSLMSYGV